MQSCLSHFYYAIKLYGSVGIVAGGFLIVIILAFALSVLPKIPFYRHERKHIIMEIGRTTGREQKYWKRQRRKLFWDLFR